MYFKTIFSTEYHICSRARGPLIESDKQMMQENGQKTRLLLAPNKFHMRKDFLFCLQGMFFCNPQKKTMSKFRHV